MDARLSVGFECEIKIAFTEAELRKANPGIQHLKVIKDHGPVQGKRAGVSQYREKKYQNWCLQNTENPLYPEETSMQQFNKPDTTCDFRMYKDEPLRLVQHILDSANIASTIHWDLSARQHDFSLAPWSLQRDASLQGLTPEQKTTAFPESICSVEDAQEVDCYGVELVSWPLTSAESARNNVKNAADALRTHLRHGFIADSETGLHAHVGCVDGSAFPMRVLQNLFLIIVLFEDEISKIHSHRRRRGAGNLEIESNRVEFYADGSDEIEREVPDPDHPGQKITQKFFQNFMSPDEIERHIFEDVDAAKDPQARFRQISGAKQHAVNFSYCFRDVTLGEGAATVEFRQHDGTSLNGDEVFHWYHHCHGLVALAQRYARVSTTITQRLGISTWDSRIDIEDLWEEMDLPVESRAFYRSRIEQFVAADPMWQPSPAVWELADAFDSDEEPLDFESDAPSEGQMAEEVDTMASTASAEESSTSAPASPVESCADKSRASSPTSSLSSLASFDLTALETCLPEE